MKKIIFLIFLIINSICSGQNHKIDSLFLKFKESSFYEDVYPSKIALENYQKEVIPELIKLVGDTTFVKLTGTADLIYPGAQKWYGHGHYVPYSMDWVSIRAGWLLEELTFQNFGFSTINIGNLNWKDKREKEKLNNSRNYQAEKVKKWWKENSDKWSRLGALKEALVSNDIKRVSNAVQYLRFGETKCNGLNQEIFINDLKPLTLKYKNSQNMDLKKISELMENEDLGNWLRNQKKNVR
ncbi:hypothetical protein [Kaistella jeonii]|uniref:Uncharacterized protein n=1 Tax=Kaistella jeonii TaxID=266749 RepID=A0A0C1ESG8_9FLAO|nr:hypothetical protein [Kaistella jeonii]KIA83947.1 hypothetical protein OA86_14915 [Kaistella jeonii]SFC43063.1 hypothetical protein SAMN05421876_1221 [Kaistella jeonii]VEI96526.1 Uncharacterised protein [Kaistella jeonii]